MSVGLMDADMMAYSLVPFNLEIMKLSTYYKKKGEIVIFSPTFSPEKNSKFVYRKDYDDGRYPPSLMRAKNVEYGGLAFSNNIYQPLPIKIERLQPDTSIYEKAEPIIMQAAGREREKKKIYQNMMTAEHCRLSLDGKTIWEDYPRQFKFLAAARNVMFHDYDLGAIDGSFEVVKKIMSRARSDGWAAKIGMKFPVRVRDGQDLLNWSSLNSNSTFYSLRFDGVMDDDTFNEWVSTCRSRAVYSQMEYHITAPWYEADRFIKEELPRIFRQVIISRSYRVFFSLKYDEGFFPDKKWEDVIRLFNYYHNSYANEPQIRYYNMIANDTLFNFASHCQIVPPSYYGDVLNKDQVRELFAFVREYHYPLFKDFYECTAEKLGGKL